MTLALRYEPQYETSETHWSYRSVLRFFLLGFSGEEMDTFVNTGVRITSSQAAKLEALATSLRMTRNQVWGMLVDSAQIESQPKVNVLLKENRNASGLDNWRIAVGQ